MCMGLQLFLRMVASLAVLGIVRALTIDSQLTFAKNDCYERLAIGQRLNPKTVYKSFDYNTLTDCQMACTEEKNSCKALSFGIGTQGNGTCEISADSIKETADLKPIGTVADTDYDLYIKKMGCSVVLDKNSPSKPPPDDSKPNIGSRPEYGEPKPGDTQYLSHGADEKPPYPSDYNTHHYLPPGNDEIHHVRAIVSVANGPNNFLHPIHDILVGENPYEYGKGYGIKYYEPSKPKGGCCEKPVRGCCDKGDRPPYRPPALNHPYDDRKPIYRPRPGDGGPYPDYDIRRGDSRPHSGYEGDRPGSERPYGPVTGPDFDRYDNYKFSRPIVDGYDNDIPPRRPFRPEPHLGPIFDNGPLPHRYGSLTPHPDEYNRRPENSDKDRYDGRPPKRYDRPTGPGDSYPGSHFDSDRYDGRPPKRPVHDRPGGPGDGYPYGDDRYDGRPPERPDYNRPGGPGDGHPYDGDKYDGRPPKRPIPDRPNGPSDGYPYDGDRYDGRPPKGPFSDRPSGQGGGYPNDDDRYDGRPPKRPFSDSPGGPGGGYPNNDDTYDGRPPKRPNHDRPIGPDGGYPYGNDRYDGGPPKRPSHDRPTGPDVGYPGYPYENDRYDGRPPKRPLPDRPGGPDDGFPGYHYDKPLKPPADSQMYDDKTPGSPKPYPETPRPASDDGYGTKPTKLDRPLDPNNPNDGYSYNKPIGENQISYDGETGVKPIVSHSVGPHGQHITSIITEIKKACFRRALAGKRVGGRCVRRALTCETVEQCQRECAEEKRFICEGFNYRLDPSGRGKGDCELLDLPLSRLDIGRDLYSDPDYDYYERDRNAATVKCKQWPSSGYPFYPSYNDGYHGGDRGGNRYDYRGDNYGYDSNRNGQYPDRRYDGPRRPDYKGDSGRPDYDAGLRRPGDRWTDDDRYDRRKPRPDLDRRHDDDYRPDGNRRGDFSYHHSHSQHDYENSRHYYNDRNRYDHGNRRYSGIHYLPAYYHKPYYERDRYDYKSYVPLPPPNRPYHDRYDDQLYHNKGGNPWGFNNHNWGSYGGLYGNFGHLDSYYGYLNQYYNRNRYDIDRRHYYLPPKVDPPKDWGLYGGSYGYGGYYPHNYHGNQHSYKYYGFYKYDDRYNDRNNYHDFHGDVPPNRNPPSYLPLPRPPGGGGYLPLPKPPGSNYPPRPSSVGSYLPLPPKPSLYDGYHSHRNGIIPPDHFDNSILPAEPRRPFTYDFIKDECSLRSAAGFRLHKGMVKKLYAVPNIYECELLCFREKDFFCQSYAYRYTFSSVDPTYNCYLSNKNYKELDHYTDLEPDRDFDIYTMNNKGRCEAPAISRTDYSDCFWRVRSGQRLDQKVVRDSLTTKSMVECQIECLKSTRFTCRAFSFRYGSPIIGGVIDNCQLTDCPYYELDPRSHFVSEPGFEVYERGSFGHGCEPDHFGIRGQHKKDSGVKVDQLCYIGFGSPARLLPQATKKALYVATELECKVECSKLREGTLFQCMSFSYRTGGPKSSPNCVLSDILQRDLLPNVDYVYDSESWLFAWDNYNPECIALANEPVHSSDAGKGSGIYDRYDWDVHYPLDTWRIYSVSGWPCRRGSLCQENRQAGFWYCELEGGDKNTWDYCCRPDHQCGASNGYPYQWCYVGPVKTQWRKCSDRYYPYVHNIIHKVDPSKTYLPPAHTNPWTPPPFRPGARPDRPPAPPLDPPPRPSLNEYEAQFDNEFLDPPKPGGFGQARHWPVSYLHQEMPPNSTTDSEPRLMKMETEKNPKYEAIKNLINVIKNNDLQNVQYQISNDSNKADDILFVRIPLPANFTQESKSSKRNSVTSNTSISLEPVYSDEVDNIQAKRSQKSLPLTTARTSDVHKENNYRYTGTTRPTPVYRRGFVTRTNITHKWQTSF